MAISSMLINIPPLEPESLFAAGQILPLVAATGVELTIVQVTPELFSASCLVGGQTQPIAVTGTTRAECLSRLLLYLVPPTPVVPVPE